MSRGPCPNCAARSIDVLVEIPRTPVHQHITFASADDARQCARGDMVLALCQRCGFAFNAAFDPALLRYSPAYDNSQEHSPAFRRYLDGRMEDLTARHALAGKTIVEIGCGQGTFLERLCEAAGARGVGFDPSADPSRPLPANVTLVPAAFDAAHPLASGDVVVARHVIEHVADPARLVGAIAEAAGGRVEAIWLETPRLEWILERRAFWDVFYEHCSYFAMAVLASIVRAHGFEVVRHDSTFGEQYQWLETGRGTVDRVARDRSSAGHHDAALDRLRKHARDFRGAWLSWRDIWRDRIGALRRRGPCVVWGAGAKGVTALNTLDPDASSIAAAIDLNPRKHGRYVPGTGHPILSPARLQAVGTKSVLVANGNYADEVRQALRALGTSVDVVVLDSATGADDARML